MFIFIHTFSATVAQYPARLRNIFHGVSLKHIEPWNAQRIAWH